MYVTNPYPLQLFISLQERLGAQYREGNQRLAEMLKGIEVSIDTHKSIKPTLARRRDEAFTKIDELESIHYLSLVLKAAIRSAEIAVAAESFRDRITYFESVQALWATHLSHQPSREIPESELHSIESQINEMRSAGTTEAAVSQRNALRAHKVTLPILGREDLQERRAQADRLQMNLELERAELQQLMAQTRFSVQVPDRMGPMLSYLGFDGQYVDETPQAPAVDVVADQPVDSMTALPAPTNG